VSYIRLRAGFALVAQSRDDRGDGWPLQVSTEAYHAFQQEQVDSGIYRGPSKDGPREEVQDELEL